MRLCVIEGHRCAAIQASLATPLDVAPHVTGAAIDVTLTDVWGSELDLGTPIDPMAEEYGLDPTPVVDEARERRQLLARVLTDVGLVNYPGAWWHWSYGDRYWALLTGAASAPFGAIRDLDGPLDELLEVSDKSVRRWLRGAA
jgi:D-alanyl-D-alanine dipeptidase